MKSDGLRKRGGQLYRVRDTWPGNNGVVRGRDPSWKDRQYAHFDHFLHNIRYRIRNVWHKNSDCKVDV